MLLFNYAGATIVALIIFLIIYSIRPVFITESNRVFFLLVIAESIGLAANLLSAWVDNNGPLFYKYVLVSLNDIYYTSYILRYFIITLYFAALLKIDNRKNFIFYLVLAIVIIVEICVIISPYVPIIYEISDDNVFSPGKYVLLIYLSNLSTIVIDIYYSIKYYKKLNLKDRIAITLSISALLCGCIIDFIFIEYVISDIFLILELLIIFLMFENFDVYYDKKTNILNFQAFSDFINDNIFRHKNCSMICFEIQNYRQLKELYGANQTNLLLKEIGLYLETNFQTKNSFYLENGRFALIKNLLPSKTLRQEAKGMIEERFLNPWTLKNNTSIKVKIIIIDLERTINFKTFNQIEACMEQATEELKKITGNEIVINDKIFDKVVRQAKVLKVLTSSLEDSSIDVFYQPIIDAKTRKIIAAEALVRLHDKEMGIIPPIDFIDMAEENGYIEELGEMVLDKVCAFLKENDLKKLGIQFINVNLSPIQCLNSNLLSHISNIINTHDVDEKMIHFEITEESMIDKKILKEQINKLISHGFKISLDDFGTGFSNFYSIKAFAFSNIKLDMTLVRDHFNTPDNLLPGIVKIFRDRNLTITAEGIETKEMADMYEKMDVTFLQGFYFSKPIPEKEFLSLIKTPSLDN